MSGASRWGLMQFIVGVVALWTRPDNSPLGFSVLLDVFNIACGGLIFLLADRALAAVYKGGIESVSEVEL